MNLGSEIRASLPECGDCINCKLIIWSEKLSDDHRCYFTVRCNWLKMAIQEPLHLKKCEGKKSHSSGN